MQFLNYKKLMFLVAPLAILMALPSLAMAQAAPGGERKANVKTDSGLVHLDFADVEIREVVKAISKITGRNFVLDDRVRGKITIISPEPVTIKEAYNAFVSALEVKNFTTVSEGKVTKIIPIREAKSSPIPSDPSTAVPYGAGFITRLIPIKYINANEISQSLKSLVSPNGNITAYGPTNSLIVTDSGSNIRRLLKIIQRLDRRGFQEGIEVVPLTYASAPQLAKTLLDLFQISNQPKKSAPKRRRRGSQDVEGGQVISKIIPDERTNSLIVIANREGIEKVLNVVRRLDHEIEVEEGKGRIHVHYLEHADSEELAQTLSGLVGNANQSSRTSSRPTSRTSRTTRSTAASRSNSNGSVSSLSLFEGDVKISPDAATNSLVITASPQDYESLKPILMKLDIPRRQVFVEAIILEINLNKALDVGANLNAAGGLGSDGSVFGGTLFNNFNSISLQNSENGLGSAIGSAAGGVFGIAGKSINIPGLGDIPIYGAVFRALQTDSVINVLSTPNILTTDNKAAEILIGENIPLLAQNTATTNGQPLQTFDRQDVGIELKVTPQINESNFVTMDIEQKIDSVKPAEENSAAALGLSTITKRTAKTTVVVEDQQTIVIGGLIQEREEDTKSKVPVLGDIPLLGWFFRSQSKQRQRTNLMIFITPSIVKDRFDLARVTREKDIQRQRFNRKNRLKEPAAFRDYEIDKRMKIDADDPETRRQPRRRSGSSYSDRVGSSAVQQATGSAYSEGYVIDKTTVVEDQEGQNTANPFGEITPPSSE